ncbi:hypothetical protein [Senegalia sp. (in: firmicutes)]|uniref:hypothetical protein n=1 Tax=Senegalia sp. (in: firmicutes) TaxID=1924098 RepID=UPI003F96D599
MKPYYENINLDFFQVFFMIVYLVIFFFLLMFIARKLLLKDDKFNRYYFIGVLSMYFVLIIGDIKFDYIPLFPDTQLYYDLLIGKIKTVPSIELTIGFGLFSRLFYFLSCGNIINYILFNSIINQIGILLLWKSFRIYKKDEISIKNQRLFLIFSAIYPVSIIYSLTLLRESYFILAFSIFLIGIMKKSKINIFLVLGTTLVIIFRTKYVIFCLMIYAIKLLYCNTIKLKYKAIGTILLIPIMYFGLNYVAVRYLNIGISPAELDDFRNSQREIYLNSGMEYPYVVWNTWLDVFKAYPLLIAQFLLSPLPILVDYDFLNSLAYTIDAFYVIIVLVLFLFNIRNNYKNLFWIVTILSIIVLSSIFEYFLTGGVRHRYVAILMFIPLLFSDKKEKGLYGNRSFNFFTSKRKYKTINFTGKKYK